MKKTKLLSNNSDIKSQMEMEQYIDAHVYFSDITPIHIIYCIHASWYGKEEPEPTSMAFLVNTIYILRVITS